MVEEVLNDLKIEMQKALDFMKKEFQRVRTGRASISLLDGIRVNYYGTPTPLNQVASLSVPESRLIVIQPWDSTMVEEIEKAIQKSELALNPMNDGKMIRIPIPPLTEERRKELVRLVKKMAEEGRIDLRNKRRDSIEILRDMKKEKEIGEDVLYRYQEEVQKITDNFVAKVDEQLTAKEKEILEI
jgi:ribosome recycling factor